MMMNGNYSNGIATGMFWNSTKEILDQWVYKNGWNKKLHSMRKFTLCFTNIQKK